MNAQIANIIKGYLTPLPWVEVSAGLIKPFIRIVPVGAGKPPVREQFPVSCDYTYSECTNGKYKTLIPSEKYRSLLYFEDMGCIKTKNEGGYNYWKSRLRLVVWVNMKRFDFNGCYISPLLVNAIEAAIPEVYFNAPPFVKVNVQSISEMPKDATIFSKWSYKEEVLQYLMYPFDYFALQIDTEFAISRDCMDAVTIKDENCDA